MADEALAGSPVVSVLVPVYNVEPFLRVCLDSLVSQSLRDIEIICIDDGSTDASPSILAEYAARDGRIRVITKENTGYGDSMNRGVAEARGTWIGVCEPDDFCDKYMFAALARAGEKYGCDIVKANYCRHYDGMRFDRRMVILGEFEYRRPFDPRELTDILLVEPSIWAAIYRRSMLLENGVRFSPTPGASFQDTSFGQQAWMSARRAVLLRPGYYHYRIDNASSSSNSEDKVFAICGEFDRTFEFLRARGKDDVALFGPVLNVRRHTSYLWNFNRIAPSCHLDFALRWASDMVTAYDEGLLGYSHMTPGLRALLLELLADVDAFCDKYSSGIPVPPLM